MKRRILMVSAMILLLGSQVDVFAQKRVEPDRKRPGMEMKAERRPGRPMDGKAISQRKIERVQDFYWMQYRVRLSKKEAAQIIIKERMERREYAVKPHGPRPVPKPMMPDPRKPHPPRK